MLKKVVVVELPSLPKNEKFIKKTPDEIFIRSFFIPKS